MSPLKDEPQKNDTPAKNVLIVEDNPTVTRALSRILKDEGYQPVIFDRGQPALLYAQQHRPAVAMIDIHLPDLSGLVLTSLFRQLFGPQTPILVFSGDTSMETLNSLQHVGASFFFPKPINVKELLDELKKWT